MSLNIMSLSWYTFLPLAGGLIGALIGAHYHKKYERKKMQRNKRN